MRSVGFSKRSRRLFLESLERRELMAGDITVTLTNGNLRVIGDARDNNLAIYQQANGRFNVVGFSGEVFTGPTTDLIVRSIFVDLGVGNDEIHISAQPDPEDPETIAPAQVIGTTTVNTGIDFDEAHVSVVGRYIPSANLTLPSLGISIDTGEDTFEYAADEANIVNSATMTLKIKTYEGADFIYMQNVTALSTSIDAGPSSIPSGVSDDDLVILDQVSAATANISLGTSAVSGELNNSLSITDSLFGTLNVNGGLGADNITILSTLVATSATVNTYGGNDNVAIGEGTQVGLTNADYQNIANLLLSAFGLSASSLPFNIFGLIQHLPDLPGILTISTGDGNDTLSLNDVVSTFSIYASLDNGDDTLTANNVDAVVNFYNGGLGTDGRSTANVDNGIFILFETTLPPPNPPTSA